MSHSAPLRWLAGTLGAAALMALGTGCYAETGAQPAYVESSSAPVDVELAPQQYYEGRTVYYVDEHWYARDRGHWVYYRKEPELLYSQRTHGRARPIARDTERRQPQSRHEVARPHREPPHGVRVE